MVFTYKSFDLRKEDLRRSLGIVLQDTFLFSDSVMENIRYGRLEASDEEFDADEVQNLLKLLDGLTPEEEKDRLSSDEVVDNFWKY